jgi:hypothetical protein
MKCLVLFLSTWMTDDNYVLEHFFAMGAQTVLSMVVVVPVVARVYWIEHLMEPFPCCWEEESILLLYY